MTDMTIKKILSANDTGETGGHQAGILIPRKQSLLSFFPSLDHSQLNPRSHILFEDHSGKIWEFAFIYYNNRFFGGTRNEYRLTRMTKFIRESGLIAGDAVILIRHAEGHYSITYTRASEVDVSRNEENRKVIQFGSGWKVIRIKGGTNA